MSERRAIKSAIWADEFFGMELTLLGRLVWIGLFSACADCQGRLRDIPELICSTLFPYGGATSREIAECLDSFGDRIIRYEIDGRKYIQLRRWWENQPQQYAVPSNFPAPPGWKDRIRTTYKGIRLVCGWDGQEDTPEGAALMARLESLGRVSSWVDYVDRLNTNPVFNPVIKDSSGGVNARAREKISENPPEKPAAESTEPAETGGNGRRPNVYRAYEREIGPLTPVIADKLIAAEEEYPPGWIEMAISEAVSQNVRKWSYISAILERWRVNGLQPIRGSPKSGNNRSSQKSSLDDWARGKSQPGETP